MTAINRLVLLLAAALITASCVGQGSRPETYQTGYNQGTFTTLFGGDVAATYGAAVKALADLGMAIRKSDTNGTEGIIEATRPEDKLPVLIRFKSQGAGSTGVAIQVGPNGDEHYSRLIAKRIAARLKG